MGILSAVTDFAKGIAVDANHEFSSAWKLGRDGIDKDQFADMRYTGSTANLMSHAYHRTFFNKTSLARKAVGVGGIIGAGALGVGAFNEAQDNPLLGLGVAAAGTAALLSSPRGLAGLYDKVAKGIIDDSKITVDKMKQQKATSDPVDVAANNATRPQRLLSGHVSTPSTPFSHHVRPMRNITFETEVIDSPRLLTGPTLAVPNNSHRGPRNADHPFIIGNRARNQRRAEARANGTAYLAKDMLPFKRVLEAPGEAPSLNETLANAFHAMAVMNSQG